MQRLYYYGSKFGPSPPPSRPQSAIAHSDFSQNANHDDEFRRSATPTFNRKPKRILKSATSRGSARKSRKVSTEFRNGDDFYNGGGRVKKSVHYEDDDVAEIFVHGQLEFLKKPSDNLENKDSQTDEKVEELTACNPISKYVVVEHYTKPKDLWRHMIKIWGLPSPNFILSVIGGGKNFQAGPMLKERLKEVLSKIASLAKVTWVITGGLDYGIMEMIGEIIQSHQISTNKQQIVVPIGIAQLHHVIGRKRSEDEIKTGSTLGYYYHQADGSKFQQDGTLDYNHTHFVLVMDSTSHPPPADAVFRPEFESYIANFATRTVPILQFLIDGGGVAIESMAKSIANEIPVIVFDGTQRFANLVSELHKKHFEDKTALRIYIAEAVRNPKYELNMNKTKTTQHADQIEAIMSKKKSHLRIVYDIYSSDSRDFDDCILQALIHAYEKTGKDEEKQLKSQLSLTMTFNRAGIAGQILTKFGSKLKVLDHITDELMFISLVQNRYKFVEVLLQQGYAIRRFLDVRTLWKIYFEIFTAEESVQVHLLQGLMNRLKGYHSSCDYGSLLLNIGTIIQWLLGDRNMNPYTSELFFFETSDSCSCPSDVKCTCSSRANAYKKMDNSQALSAEKHLFLQSIILGRKEMAFVFWKEIREGIGFALLGSAMSRRLSNVAKSEGNPILAQEFLGTSRQFEESAIGVLSEAFHRKRDLSFKLLRLGINVCHKRETTVLFLADKLNIKGFMAQQCCQNMLDILWKGDMSQQTGNMMVLLSILLPVIIPLNNFNIENRAELNTATYKQQKEIASENHIAETDKNSSEIGEDNKKHSNTFCSCCCPLLNSSNRSNIGQKFISFYTAPITIFWMNFISFLFLLLLLCYMVLTDLHPNTPRSVEIVVYIWVITMFIEKTRQAIFSPDFTTWIKRFWNMYDIILYSFFVISVILRLLLPVNYFTGAVIVYSLTLFMCCIRTLEASYISKVLGSKVVLVARMILKLLPFVLIMFVFLVGVGIVYSANLYPNSPLDRVLLRQIVFQPYFQIYGEFFIDEMEGDSPSYCSNNATEWRSSHVTRCPQKNAVVIVMTAFYLILVHLLVIHLIIAMFSTIYKKEYEISETTLNAERFAFVYEYCNRPILPAPLIIFCHLYRAALFLYHISKKTKVREKTNHIEAESLNTFEKECKYSFVLKSKSQMDNGTKLESISKNLKEQKENIRKIYEKMLSIEEKRKHEQM